VNKALTGKVAPVTGGSRSLGAASAKRLDSDGADVALTYSASPDGERRGWAAADQAFCKSISHSSHHEDCAKSPSLPLHGRLDFCVDRRSSPSSFNPSTLH
jgi:NAD(P)-dependent dehydrogenase (short-subunit alcohol dehydrogenase family)